MNDTELDAIRRNLDSIAGDVRNARHDVDELQYVKDYGTGRKLARARVGMALRELRHAELWHRIATRRLRELAATLEEDQ